MIITLSINSDGTVSYTASMTFEGRALVAEASTRDGAWHAMVDLLREVITSRKVAMSICDSAQGGDHG